MNDKKIKQRKINPDTGEKIYPKRSQRQNRALHLYFKLIAEALNDAGLDMRTVLKPEVDISWNMGNVKEYLWRPIMKLQVGKDSTTDLDTTEIDAVFNTLNRFLSEKGISEPFPSIESIMDKMRQEEELL